MNWKEDKEVILFLIMLFGICFIFLIVLIFADNSAPIGLIPVITF